MAYRIAGIDVHKKMLAVVVSDVEVDGGFQFERRRFAGNPEQLRSLAAWLLEQKAEEIVMESTAQYWKPAVIEVWISLSKRRRREFEPPARGARSKPRHAWTGRMVRGRPAIWSEAN